MLLFDFIEGRCIERRSVRLKKWIIIHCRLLRKRNADRANDEKNAGERLHEVVFYSIGMISVRARLAVEYDENISAPVVFQTFPIIICEARRYAQCGKSAHVVFVE